MTKRDYELIAYVLSCHRHAESPRQQERIDAMAQSFARHLSTGNPRFDKDKFLTACRKLPPWVTRYTA